MNAQPPYTLAQIMCQPANFIEFPRLKNRPQGQQQKSKHENHN